jgi:hypothetical protein
VGTGVTVDTTFTKTRINTTVKAGFHADQWVRFTSLTTQAKDLAFDGATTALQVVVGATNVINRTAGPGAFEVVRAHSGDASTHFQLEKQGNFMMLSWYDSTGADTDPNFTGASVTEGDWITLAAPFSALNRGTFRIVQRAAATNQVYFENPYGVEELVVPGVGLPRIVSYDSVRVGDIFVISGTILGAANAGTYTVTAVNSSTQIVVNGTMVNAGPTVLAAAYTQVQVLEQDPFEAIKQIHTVAVDPVSSAQTDVILHGTTLNGKLSAAANTQITALNKFAFPTAIQTGVDGYRKYLGLISESNKIVYGDPTDPSTYPGVKAAGAQLNIEGPVIKRIQVALAIRVRTGTPFSIVQEQVVNNVTATINKVPLGTSIVISDFVSAAGSVDGVLAVSVVSPTYSSSSDLIAVSAFEKPLVVDPQVDVLITEVV